MFSKKNVIKIFLRFKWVLYMNLDEDIVRINNQIKSIKESGRSVKLVSDSHHTFNELYIQRTILFAALCNAYPNLSWKSKKHYDEENDPMFEGDFIVGINTPDGIATYHFKLEYWDLFNVQELDRALKYDGYEPEIVMERIKSLIKR